MNRSIRWAARLGAAVVLTTAVTTTLVASPAQAETTSPSILQESTFWKSQERAPAVDTPCSPVQSPPPAPTPACGPVSPGAQSSPYVPDGTMVVQHAGGPAGPDRGDLMWAAMEFDVLDVGPEGTVEKFTLTLFRAANVSNDYKGGKEEFKACNIVAPWGGAEGTSPWQDRPLVDCSNAVGPTRSTSGLETFTFDLTDFAQTWAEGKGYGVAFVPGKPGAPGPVNSDNNQQDIPPYKISFATSNAQTATRPGESPQPEPRFRPRVSMTYTPGEDLLGEGGTLDELLDDFGEEDFGGDELGGSLGDEGFGDTTLDTGEELALEEPTGDASDEASPRRRIRTQPISSEPGFPWFLLLLLPLGLVGFWGSGTALGEAGDPLPPRTGGVSRVLARRTPNPTTKD